MLFRSPILKDIPWIGKWLFGTVSQTETRKELLVFMTPYVLEEGDAAQAEALRRKKALSDTRPWDDHGWSASPLADPVSKKEQMRRLKDEWKKQDEERKTKLAIEDEKVKRAKALEQMSKEERKAHGLNDSMTHVDFMIGTPDLSITGTTQDGEEIPVFRNGNFVF